jgi:NADH-quinone oxidoreductase subunit K
VIDVVPLEHVVLLSTVLFGIGIYGVLSRRNAVAVLMAIELMLNAVNINFIGFGMYLAPDPTVGQIIAVFVITVAAAEAALGLAIIFQIFRNKSNISVDELDLLRW